MNNKKKRRVGSGTCWNCHHDFPLYEGQRRKYCDECLLAIASEAGKRGGRGNKKSEA